MLFNKRNLSQFEEILSVILDAQDADMIIVRGEDCRVLFMSPAARENLQVEGLSTTSCREGYAKVFRGLCERCPNNNAMRQKSQSITTQKYDAVDETGGIISVTGTNVEWMDRTLATALFLRDVDEKRALEKKLYSLAYKDQLTDMPNRQKLLEDSEIIMEYKEKNISGAVAMLDLDNFKAINDTYGHNSGDIMLKRLTEHLNSDSVFGGHLYRLGGDEFVMFLKNDADDFKTQEDMCKYYEDILKNAFLSYSLPNIELACTISMGVAFFPVHGETISELLRKADIALYKSKTAGRNRMTFFEDKFDEAKKFKNFYINIQPILCDGGRTYGYELVDTGNEGENSDTNFNLGDFDRALDALGLDDLRNNSRYFIANSQRMQNKSALNNLPKDKFIIQIHTPSNPDEKDWKTYRTLRSQGYSLAFTGLTAQNITSEIIDFADYCRFEHGEVPAFMQKKLIESNPKKDFIATRVDTKQAYDVAKAMGYSLYQGLFFDQPVVTQKTKDIEPLKINYLRLLQLTSTEDYVDFSQITDVIASDVALSYKLLRLLNSAAVGLRNRISSISMAVSYLGEENLKKWIALLSIRGVAYDKPLELVRISLIRAQFGELLATNMNPQRNTKYAFMAGMFSLLHIALEKSKEELMEEIQVADDIRSSILTTEGPYSDLLKFFDDYERSEWDEVTKFADRNHLSSQVIYESYTKAIKWYNDLVGAD